MLAEQAGNCIQPVTANANGIAITATADSRLQGCAQCPHESLKLGLRGIEPDLQSIYFAAWRVSLAQPIETFTALRLVCIEAATECGIVSSRVIDGSTDRCQHILRPGRGAEAKPAQWRGGHQRGQRYGRLQTAAGAECLVDLRRPA